MLKLTLLCQKLVGSLFWRKLTKPLALMAKKVQAQTPKLCPKLILLLDKEVYFTISYYNACNIKCQLNCDFGELVS